MNHIHIVINDGCPIKLAVNNNFNKHIGKGISLILDYESSKRKTTFILPAPKADLDLPRDLHGAAPPINDSNYTDN